MAHARRLLLALCLPVLSGPAAPVSSAGRDTWQWSDILDASPTGPETALCDGPHPIRTIPDFGNGLIGSYTFTIDQTAGSPEANVETINLLPTGRAWDISAIRRGMLAFPRPLPHGPATITVDDNFVLVDMDDVLDHYRKVCESNRKPGLILRSISYRRATSLERAATPPRQYWNTDGPPMPPVPVMPKPGSADILPAPVPGGDVRFSWAPGAAPLSPPYPQGFQSTRVQLGAGVHVAALFDGQLLREPLGILVDAGFVPMTIEQAGRIETLVIDPTLLDSEAKLRERIGRLLHSPIPVGYGLRGIRLAFFPADRGTIDGLPLPLHQLDLLKEQILALRTELTAAQDARMTKPVDSAEVEKILASEWSRFGNRPQGSGYDALFGHAGSTFGSLHDMACHMHGHIFDCTAGVLFAEAGIPRYQTRTLAFARTRSPYLLQPGDGTTRRYRHAQGRRSRYHAEYRRSHGSAENGLGAYPASHAVR
jgi:hypothetical protein